MSAADINWLLAVIGSKQAQRKARVLWEKREREFNLSFERGYDALSELQRRSCIVSLHQDFDVADFKGTKVVLVLKAVLDDWISLREVGNFVLGFCSQATARNLTVMIDKSDLESYRLASTICSRCQEREKAVVLVDQEGKSIEPLYGPPVNITTKKCLFSIVDYIVRHGGLPDFIQLKDHHFANLPVLETQDPERSRRAWAGKEDSKYVSALYATLRVLERHSLIMKTVDPLGRKILSIEPTWNGVYCVVFSDLLPLFSQTLRPEI